MATLSYQSIKRRCIEKNLIYPWSEKTIERGMSWGLSQNGYDIRIAEDLVLYPISLWNLVLKTIGFKRPSFALAYSIENFNMPADLRFTVADKSSWARLGLTVQNTIGEAGWKPKENSTTNTLTLELTNHSDNIIFIKAGSPIAQILFDTLDEPTQKPYANGKYAGQGNKAVDTIFEQNKESYNTLENVVWDKNTYN